MATNKADTPSAASAEARTPDPAARWRHLAGLTLDRAPALPYPMMAAIPVHLPSNLLQVLLTLAAYTIFGWAGLALVWSTWRFRLGQA